MSTLLAERHRRAAHGLHVCTLCRHRIAARELYLDQRVADWGTVYTARAHIACFSAFWSWFEPAEEPDHVVTLQDLSGGHLPPCWHAWNRDPFTSRPPFVEPFIGPRPPCTCEATP